MSDELEIARLEAVDNQMDKLIETAKAASELAPVSLLEGWSVQRRSYGVGTCFGGSGDVLCYGKWGVIGGTGRYKILFPSGWIEERPKFKTELEAMLWVMNKTKPCKQCGTSVEVAGDACYDATCPKQPKPSNAPDQRPAE